MSDNDLDLLVPGDLGPSTKLRKRKKKRGLEQQAPVKRVRNKEKTMMMIPVARAFKVRAQEFAATLGLTAPAVVRLSISALYPSLGIAHPIDDIPENKRRITERQQSVLDLKQQLEERLNTPVKLAVQRKKKIIKLEARIAELEALLVQIPAQRAPEPEPEPEPDVAFDPPKLRSPRQISADIEQRPLTFKLGRSIKALARESAGPQLGRSMQYAPQKPKRVVETQSDFMDDDDDEVRGYDDDAEVEV